MKKLTTLSFAAIAAAAFASSAYAQNVPVNSSDTDMILAFRVDDSTGTGFNSDLEVDLGSYSQFTQTATIASFTGLTSSDLSATYGSSFATRGDLVFDAAADVNAGGTAPGSFGLSSAFVTQSGAPQGDKKIFTTSSGALANISAEDTTLGSTAQTADSTTAGVVGNSTSPASGIVGSLSNEATLSNNLEYGYFNENGSGVADTEAIVGSGAAGVTELALYSYAYTQNSTASPAPTLLGDFFLTNSGQLSYVGLDAAAVPEPSTWALMLGGAGFLFLAVRRRWMSDLN